MSLWLNVSWFFLETKIDEAFHARRNHFLLSFLEILTMIYEHDQWESLLSRLLNFNPRAVFLTHVGFNFLKVANALNGTVPWNAIQGDSSPRMADLQSLSGASLSSFTLFKENVASNTKEQIFYSILCTHLSLFPLKLYCVFSALHVWDKRRENKQERSINSIKPKTEKRRKVDKHEYLTRGVNSLFANRKPSKDKKLEAGLESERTCKIKELNPAIVKNKGFIFIWTSHEIHLKFIWKCVPCSLLLP